MTRPYKNIVDTVTQSVSRLGTWPEREHSRGVLAALEQLEVQESALFDRVASLRTMHTKLTRQKNNSVASYEPPTKQPIAVMLSRYAVS
jgi:hypothetical protein